jgi:hypothetical protein
LLDAASQRIDVDLQRLDRTLQEVQSRYDEIMRVEDQRLKSNAKTARKHEAEKLGNAKSIQEAATMLLRELKLQRDILAVKGLVSLLGSIASMRFPCSSGLSLDAIGLKIDAAEADLHAKSQITDNHSAAEKVAGAQQELYIADDRIKELKNKLKSNVLTGNFHHAFNGTR